MEGVNERDNQIKKFMKKSDSCNNKSIQLAFPTTLF